MTRLYKNIVILTGAGISAESGLATFRSSNGLWNNHRVEDVATIEAYWRNPDYVHQFYNEMRPELYNAKPNPAHLCITELQKKYPAHIAVVTQNVDTLHEKAGNQNVFHIHGQINQIVCMNCGHVFETWGDVSSEDKCEHCGTTGMLKPNIVFFGESLLYMDQVDRLLNSCDLFVSVGTSGVVYPAAGFVQFAKMFGADTYEFNMEETSNNSLFDKHIYGPAGTTLPQFVQQLLADVPTKEEMSK
ncbi:MAG: NAD-dependent deacylase [Alphaproteobacteria bacterium]|nr:NAD-dependent deacylase [Alphaproteobacteria bacterium]